MLNCWLNLCVCVLGDMWRHCVFGDMWSPCILGDMWSPCVFGDMWSPCILGDMWRHWAYSKIVNLLSLHLWMLFYFLGGGGHSNHYNEVEFRLVSKYASVSSLLWRCFAKYVSYTFCVRGLLHFSVMCCYVSHLITVCARARLCPVVWVYVAVWETYENFEMNRFPNHVISSK